MSTGFITYLEQIAYEKARVDYCIPERASKKIAMPELFDMIAGSDTGAIVGSVLVLPNKGENKAEQENRYFAEDASALFN